MLRALVAERMDPVLFAYSYDYVGDLAETVSLVWQPKAETRPNDRDISLAGAVELLSSASRSDGPRVLESLLDRMEAPARFAIIKLVTGGLRVGVSAGWPSRRWPRWARSMSTRSRNCGTGSPRPMKSSSPGWKAAPKSRSRPRAPCSAR
jgi:hypothetical protein